LFLSKNYTISSVFAYHTFQQNDAANWRASVLSSVWGRYCSLLHVYLNNPADLAMSYQMGRLGGGGSFPGHHFSTF